MQPHAAERRHLERQIAYARPIFMVLALGDLLERPPQDRGPSAILSFWPIWASRSDSCCCSTFPSGYSE